MTDEIKHENTGGHGSYERQDLGPKAILYFLLALGVAIVLSLAGLKGVFTYLDHREKADQPRVSPLITSVPGDTRHIAGEYPRTAFPDPRLEKIEGEELDQDLTREQSTLYSYGWVDENAGTVHIPIERAMELIVERGLPVRPQAAVSAAAAAKPEANRKDNKK